jgi:hypothetical protein
MIAWFKKNQITDLKVEKKVDTHNLRLQYVQRRQEFFLRALHHPPQLGPFVREQRRRMRRPWRAGIRPRRMMMGSGSGRMLPKDSAWAY